MAQPMILVLHRERRVQEAILAAVATGTARARAVGDLAMLPWELRRLGPDVVLIPFDSSSPAIDPILSLIRADTPTARIVLLTRDFEIERAGEMGCFGVLPIEPEVDPDEARALLERALATAPSQGSVLLVDDDEVTLEMMTDVLQSRGYRVLRATCGEEGLAVASMAAPDVILLDVHLPGMSGPEALRELKGREATAGIPVIMVSSNGTEAAVSISLDAGAIDFVTKPFSPRQLAEKVAHVVARREVLATA